VTESTREAAVEVRWSEPLLEERCRILRSSLRARGESDADLDALAPGGSRNQLSDPFGAKLHWYALLQGRLAFVDWKDEENQRRAEHALAAALSNEPAALTLHNGQQVAVYPKSYHALAWCDALDRALADATQKAIALEELEVTTFVPLVNSLAARLWVWILTCREPGVPFDEGTPGDPPGWTLDLAPEDYLAILEAHVRVNRARIALVATLFPPDREAASRLSLSGFLGTVAQDLGHRPSDVLRRWSLGEAFAQAVVAAQSAREARKRAEDEAASRRTA
jgi:hypothetical protein